MANKTNNTSAKLYPSWVLAAIAGVVMLAALMYNYFSSQEDYFYALHLHTLFTDNEPYYEELQRNSAWLMTLVGSYLTQFFMNAKFPSIAIPLLCVCQFLILEGLFSARLRKWSFALTCALLLPSLLAYISGQNYDYAIYDRFDGSSYLVLFLGQMLSVGLFALSRIPVKFSYAIALVLSLMLSPFVGIFSLVSVLMVCSDSVVEKNKQKMMVSSLFFVAAIGLMLFCGANRFHEFWYITLFAPLINQMYNLTFYYALASVVVHALLPLLQLVAKRDESKVTVTPILLTMLCSVVMMFVSTDILAYKDQNFYAELKAKRLLDNHEWKKLYTLTSKVKNPTTTIIAYQELATMLREKMIKDAFNIEPAFFSYNTSHFATSHFIHYTDLAYYAGLPNTSLFYAMETKQLSGLDFGVLKNMQEAAMLNKEYDLARKYQDLLASSPVYEEYAETWRGYIADTSKMYRELPHLRLVERLIDYSPAVYSATSIQEVIMNRAALVNGLTLLVRLYCDMYQRDMKRFSQDVVACRNYFETRKVPSVIQEACVICDLAGDHLPMQNIRVDNDVFTKTCNIVKEVNAINNNKLATTRLKSRYKGSYTYYYLLSTTDNSMYKGAVAFKKDNK